MIVILTGAKKNVGDFLIGSRAKKLLREYVDDDIVELDRFERLDAKLDVINSSKALILCGGPAYAENIYPGIYPLVDDLSKITAPIIPFGLGWSGSPANKPDRFSFTHQSRKLLQDIHANIKYSSCRDKITEEILHQSGFKNVLMTGCPVWYDLQSIGKPFACSGEFARIVFTTPASPALLKQTYELMNILRQTFPDSEISCSFHRGILPDKHTSIRYSLAYLTMSALAKKLGYKVVDTSFALEKIDFYKQADLHVGYRVHAHLDFLSRRMPSILINEDGRGLGMVQSMMLPTLNINDPELITKLNTLLSDYKNNNYGKLQDIDKYLDKQFNIMKEFLSTIK